MTEPTKDAADAGKMGEEKEMDCGVINQRRGRGRPRKQEWEKFDRAAYDRNRRRTNVTFSEEVFLKWKAAKTLVKARSNDEFALCLLELLNMELQKTRRGKIASQSLLNEDASRSSKLSAKPPMQSTPAMQPVPARITLVQSVPSTSSAVQPVPTKLSAVHSSTSTSAAMQSVPAKISIVQTLPCTSSATLTQSVPAGLSTVQSVSSKSSAMQSVVLTPLVVQSRMPTPVAVPVQYVQSSSSGLQTILPKPMAVQSAPSFYITGTKDGAVENRGIVINPSAVVQVSPQPSGVVQVSSKGVTPDEKSSAKTESAAVDKPSARDTSQQGGEMMGGSSEKPAGWKTVSSVQLFDGKEGEEGRWANVVVKTEPGCEDDDDQSQAEGRGPEEEDGQSVGKDSESGDEAENEEVEMKDELSFDVKSSSEGEEQRKEDSAGCPGATDDEDDDDDAMSVDDDDSGDNVVVIGDEDEDDDDDIGDNDDDDSDDVDNDGKTSESLDSVNEGPEDLEKDLDETTIDCMLSNERDSYHHLPKGFFGCKRCENVYRTRSKRKLLEHLLLHKDKNELFICAECGFVATTKLRLNRHQIKHGPRKFQCSECPYSTYLQFLLNNHKVRCHTPDSEKRYICLWKDCNRKYALEGDLKVHSRAHTLESVCHICGQTGSVTFLAGHMAREHGGKPAGGDAAAAPKILCDLCGRQYSSKSHVAYERHMMNHYNNKPYKCRFCTKGFVCQKFLQEHERIHTGEKPFKCQLCELAFAKKAQLTSHERTHTGEKPYKCKDCKYESTWNIQLRHHAKAHGSPTEVSCQLCQISFISQKALNIHNKKHHRSTE